MGWSCRSDAARILDVWTKACLASTNTQNTFISKGIKYFYEISRTEHYDGAITGTVMKQVMVPGQRPDQLFCKPAGSFRIEGDGTVTRAPAFLKNALKTS